MYQYLYLNHIIKSKEIIKGLEDYQMEGQSNDQTDDQADDLKTILAFRGPIEKTKCLTAYDPSFDDDLTHESLNRYLLKKAVVSDKREIHTQTNDHESAQKSGHMVLNLNWLEANITEDQDLISLLRDLLKVKPLKYKVAIMGLGDVGATVALGLKLLGGDVISELCLWDLNPKQAERQAIELNQILVNPDLLVKSISMDQLFDGDVFVFCASKYVPKVGEQVADVRMAQLSQNAPLVSQYLSLARQKAFKGLFCIVSDPVDLLCKAAFESNLIDPQGFQLMPEQIRGYGLGVMYARAKYYGGSEFKKGRAFGPHGKDLVIANDIEDYREDVSLALTQEVVTANLKVRDLGFKPYIAPAISSGAFSIVKTLEGDWHESAVFLGGSFWGCRNRWGAYGSELEELVVPLDLYQRMRKAYERLETLWTQYT